MSSLRLTHASLFSGIGGFDLAAEWAGMINLFNCDNDPFCRRVLKHHFPYATQYADIKTTDFIPHRGSVDVLTGGFPCQPFSMAGKRRGTDDDRYLWPEMLRVVREIRPGWIVGENVLGIVNWSDGLVFEQVCADLEAEGYCVQPYVLPACGVDAPHQRYRTWFVAHAIEDSGCNRCLCGSTEQEGAAVRGFGIAGAGSGIGVHLRTGIAADGADAGNETMSERADGTVVSKTAADASRLEDIGWRRIGFLSQSAGPVATGTTADSCDPRLERTDESGCCENRERLQVRRYVAGCGDEDAADPQSERLPERDAEPSRNGAYTATQRHRGIPGWDDFPTQPPVCGGDDGFSELLDPDAVFAGQSDKLRKRRSHAVRWKTESIKCYGNAIVPQVVYRILSMIRLYECRLRGIDPNTWN